MTYVKFESVQSANVTPVQSSATVVPLMAANTSAHTRIIFNESTAILYVKFGDAASASDYTVQVAAGGTFTFPTPLYCGKVTGLWASANGYARITEY